MQLRHYMMRGLVVSLLLVIAGIGWGQEQQEEAPIVIPGMPQLAGDVVGNMQGIYQQGLALGNRPDVFSKVGDSSTAVPYFLMPLGEGYANLGDFEFLQGIVDYYSVTRARTNNSFVNTSLAAGIGWTSASVTNPDYANRAHCERNESPLRCEYRISQPTISIIMLGTNEVTWMSAEDYQANMQRVVDTSVAMGVIPVLTTIPDRRGNEENVDSYNQVLREIAVANRIPLIEYAPIMRTLPNDGLDSERKHPTAVPGNQYRGSVDFTGENLRYGFTMRNLMTLQMLGAIRAHLP